MALAMNASLTTAAAPSVVSLMPGSSSMLKQSPSSCNTVRFTNGAIFSNQTMARGGATGRRSTLVRVRAEEPRSSRSTDSAPPPPSSTPPGASGTEVPLGVITSSAPLAQGREKPVGERIAYICQVCGYVYNEETPFEDVSEDYNCPKCSAPKNEFTMANATVDEVWDPTKSGSASSNN
jgi:rubredoxin